MNIATLLTKLKSFKIGGSAKGAAVTPRSVLTALLVLVIVADIWVAQSALRAVYKYMFADVGAQLAQTTRVNFEGLNQAAERYEQADGYLPGPVPANDPFKAIVKDK